MVPTGQVGYLAECRISSLTGRESETATGQINEVPDAATGELVR